MHFIKIVLLSMIIASCTTLSPTVSYRPSDAPNSVWLINGHAEIEALKDKIIININGQRAITGMLSKNKAKDSFIGSYQEKALRADCHITANGLVYDHHCTVFVDNQRAATLHF